MYIWNLDHFKSNLWNNLISNGNQISSPTVQCCQTYSSLFFSLQNKQYPALPDEIDFSLLQENEEWEIFFSCILPFTEIVFSTVQEDAKEVFRINKICSLLIALSKIFSRYYNRVRILREPLPHFLPTIFCRISFLKSIQITFEHGFALLDISPIRKM